MIQQLRIGQTFYLYVPEHQLAMACSTASTLFSYFWSFDKEAPHPHFDVTKLNEFPDVWQKIK